MQSPTIGTEVLGSRCPLDILTNGRLVFHRLKRATRNGCQVTGAKFGLGKNILIELGATDRQVILIRTFYHQNIKMKDRNL